MFSSYKLGKLSSNYLKNLYRAINPAKIYLFKVTIRNTIEEAVKYV